ncbi:MAG TPA: acyltransferase [Roseomonas sp.]|jgi:peptidoglycan/LPS O-acetylase OafA/YrhL
MQGQIRSARIDFLRGLSILLVLLHHFNIAYRLDDTALSALFGWDAVRAVARNGNYGVTMFFVISGFLITGHALRRWGSLAAIDARAFYIRRAARILPCLLLLLVAVNLLGAAGIAIFQTRAPGVAWQVDLAALTFWMNVLIARDGWVNYPLGVLWSLSVEEVFYLAFPLLCLALRRPAWLAVVLAALIVAGPLWRAAHAGDEGGFLYAYLACFDGIAIGCATALLARRLGPGGRRLAVLQSAAAGGMAGLYLQWPIGAAHVAGVTAMALGTATLLLDAGRAADRAHGPVLAGFGWLGRHSYELYLFHLLVLGGLRTVFPPRGVVGDAKLLLLAAFLALSAAIAAAIARCYAEPLNRWIRRRLPDPLAPQVAVPER